MQISQHAYPHIPKMGNVYSNAHILSTGQKWAVITMHKILKLQITNAIYFFIDFAVTVKLL